MVDIRHRVGITAPQEQVYEALSTVEGLSGWWTRDTAGDPAIGGKLEFFFGQAERPAERFISADPGAWYTATAEHMGPEAYEDYRRAIHDPATVHAMMEDYRARLGIDREHALAVALRRTADFVSVPSYSRGFLLI